MLFRQIYHSPIGEITIIASDKALVGVWLADQKYFAEGLSNQTIKNQCNNPVSGSVVRAIFS